MDASISCRHCELPLTPTEDGYRCTTPGCTRPGHLKPSGGAGVVIVGAPGVDGGTRRINVKKE